MILKIFLPKKIAKKLAFLTQNKAKLCKILIITSVFEKNANFIAENWQKSQKIVIITSTPGSCKDLLLCKSDPQYLGIECKCREHTHLGLHSFVDIQITNRQNVDIQTVHRLKNVDIIY
jgi:hypothetical protein